jgi:hypothetical protein
MSCGGGVGGSVGNNGKAFALARITLSRVPLRLRVPPNSVRKSSNLTGAGCPTGRSTTATVQRRISSTAALHFTPTWVVLQFARSLIRYYHTEVVQRPKPRSTSTLSCWKQKHAYSLKKSNQGHWHSLAVVSIANIERLPLTKAQPTQSVEPSCSHHALDT